MKKILLHICCAPCAIFSHQLLLEKGFQVKGFFFNPNIQPLSEYNMRFQALQVFAKNKNLEFTDGSYKPEIFFRAINQKESLPERCQSCWRLRLKETARKAKEEKLDYFTTTLLGSPYQDTNVLEKIGDEEAGNFGIKFYKDDFRAGFRKAHGQARQEGLYCQKYCGCIYSELERFKAKSCHN